MAKPLEDEKPEELAMQYAIEQLGKDATPAALRCVSDAFIAGYLVAFLKLQPTPPDKAN